MHRSLDLCACCGCVGHCRREIGLPLETNLEFRVGERCSLKHWLDFPQYPRKDRGREQSPESGLCCACVSVLWQSILMMTVACCVYVR